MTRKFVFYDKEELKLAVESSICWSDVCRVLGITVCHFNIKRVRQLSYDNSIDVSHFNVKLAFRKGKMQWKEEDIFVENSKITRGTLRSFLKRNGMYDCVCSECKNADNWNGKPLTIEVDHINGDCTDNRKENLRWLCPNCHSQTTTYRRGFKPRIKKIKYALKDNICDKCGLKILKTSKHCNKCSNEMKLKFQISKEELQALIQKFNYSKIGRMYGFSATTIRKRAKFFGLLD